MVTMLLKFQAESTEDQDHEMSSSRRDQRKEKIWSIGLFGLKAIVPQHKAMRTHGRSDITR